MKKDSFKKMEELQNDLGLHPLATKRAKEMYVVVVVFSPHLLLLICIYSFAVYRDAMESIHNYSGILLACLVIGLEDVGADVAMFDEVSDNPWENVIID
jgi:hypothetical protein